MSGTLGITQWVLRSVQSRPTNLQWGRGFDPEDLITHDDRISDSDTRFMQLSGNASTVPIKSLSTILYTGLQDADRYSHGPTEAPCVHDVEMNSRDNTRNYRGTT